LSFVLYIYIGDQTRVFWLLGSSVIKRAFIHARSRPKDSSLGNTHNDTTVRETETHLYTIM